LIVQAIIKITSYNQ